MRLEQKDNTFNRYPSCIRFACFVLFCHAMQASLDEEEIDQMVELYGEAEKDNIDWKAVPRYMEWDVSADRIH